MAKEVRIIWVAHELKGTGPLPTPKEGKSDARMILETSRAEMALSKLVTDGWEIVAAGGGAGYSTVGFIVIQRDKEEKSADKSS